MKKVYDHRELKIKSGDLILCAGRSRLSEHVQRFQRYTGADAGAWTISHVAMFYAYLDSPLLFVEESTSLNKWADKSGTQMNRFDEWLEHYNGEVYVKHLYFERTKAFGNRDVEFWLKHQDLPYENGIPGAIELVLCGLRLHRVVRTIFPNYTPKFTKNPHCTELVSRRLLAQDLFAKKDVLMNRMPPWIWWQKVNEMLNVPTSENIRIK